MQPVEFYNHYKSELEDLLKKVKSKIALLGILRLVVFIGTAYFVYLQWNQFSSIHYLIVLLAIIVFIWLVKISANAVWDKESFLAQIRVIENELVVKEGGDSFFSNGEKYLHATSTSFDLDLFGKKSIFHFLNRTHTSYGNSLLSSRILNSELNIEKLYQDQHKIKAFSLLPKLNIEISAYYRLEENASILKNMQVWMRDEKKYFTSQWMTILKWMVPLISIGLITVGILLENILWASLPILFLPIVTRLSIKGLSIQEKITDYESYIHKYTVILGSFINHTKENSVLEEEHQEAKIAFKELKKLHRHLEMLESTNNLLVKIFLNSYLFYEIHCLSKIEDWKNQHHKAFPSWELLIGKIEYYVSLGTYAFNFPTYEYPTFEKEKLIIQAKGIQHPLMFGYAVSNDIEIGQKEQLVLLTGSNMSGKTTFLRTIGVNVIIGQLGAPVAAKVLLYTPLKVMTSIRISDSLQENTSYFKAELNQLKTIIDAIKLQEAPILVLIDEILKGTNSEDKTNGSAAYMHQLMNNSCLSIFATHDLILSELEKQYPQKMSNYCFESTITQNELYFNYQIQPGVAQNKNASFLMKKMGIIE